jgi:NO-binding membrane sensor protein with MHYT domain/nitrogen-specific signal transduction histidine kinase
MHMQHFHEPSLVFLSVIIAIFASYTALDLVNSISASKGRMKLWWLVGSSLAMGIGIWSMHFIGMLAFKLSIPIYYDVPLLVLSIVVAIMASALALFIVSSREPNARTYFLGSVLMGAAISGMHYIGIASMRLKATIEWDWTYVTYSILIAFAASYVALFAAFKLRDDLTLKGFIYRGLGGILLGVAIAGMHYTAMAAMTFDEFASCALRESELLATDGLASAVIIGTIIVLGIALSGSNVDRALSRKTLLNEILQQGIKTRDEFLSKASHEIRTPLTSIKLQTQLALRQIQTTGIADQEKIVRMLQNTDRNLDRLTRLVDDMLDITRLSNGKLILRKETFDLDELLSDVIDRFRPLLQDARCEIHFNSNSKILGNWDRFRTEQVIVNLLNNAAKYAPGKPIKVSLSLKKNEAIISVRDEGKGIPIEDQKRVFLRFERANEMEAQSGLGLGLYIVKEIISLHGGDIKLYSKVNEGAEFVVSLPV